VKTEANVRAGAPSFMSAETWSGFAAEVWEKRPVVLPQACPKPPATHDTLFAALVAASDLARTTGDGGNFGMWCAGYKLTNIMGLLPESADCNIPSYLQRVDHLVGGENFTLLLANPHLVSNEIQRRMWFFVRDMIEHTGQPCGGVDSSIFIGSYSQTPFGVHRGQMSVMTFPVYGIKRFLLWPRGYGQEHIDIQDSLSYDAHRGAAQVLQAQPGDLMYWPADWWHVADDRKRPSAAFNIGFWWDKPPLDRALLAMSEALSRADVPRNHGEAAYDPLQISFPPPCAGNGPNPDLSRAAQMLRAVICNRSLTDRLHAEWLAFRSSQCLRDVAALPPRLPAVTWGSTLTPFAAGAVLIAPLDADRMVVAANGIAREFPAHPAAWDFCSALATGKSVQLTCRGDAHEQTTLRALASFIVGTGAVDVNVQASRAEPLSMPST